MKTRLVIALIAMAGLPAASLIPAQAESGAASTKMQKVEAMHLITGNTGWVTGRANLMLTKDAGQHWTDITPKTVGNIQSVFFLDATEGWVVSASGTTSAPFAISRTSDAGATWTSAALTVSFEAGSSPVSLEFADAQHGWLTMRARSSSNFSWGTLLATSDGGASWKALPTPPIADAIRFISASTGWLAGGPGGNDLFITRDGGLSWQRQTVAAPAGLDTAAAVYQLPTFVNDNEGTLAVEFIGPETSQVVVYATQNAGLAWAQHNAVTTRSGLNRSLASVVDANTFFVAAGSREGLVASTRGAQIEDKDFYSELASYEAVTALDFTDDHNGWVLVDGGYCAVGKTQCSQESRLLATSDGGQTVKDVTPLVAGSASTSGGVQPLVVTTLTGDLPGFDRCESPSIAQMKAWYVQTPWEFANVYIGGDNRGCSQPNLWAGWISAIEGQGWYLLPSWVGPQSPTVNSGCKGCSKMSTNTTTAKQQGVEQADAATDEANALGLPPQTIIYYDMEEYSGVSGPVRAFVAGWVEELHNRGNLAGVYGAPANAGNDWDADGHPPDDVWIADWNGSTSVYNLSGLPNGMWSNNQRIHQYKGNVYETWGGVRLEIDVDSSDGAVQCADYCQ